MGEALALPDGNGCHLAQWSEDIASSAHCYRLPSSWQEAFSVWQNGDASVGRSPCMFKHRTVGVSSFPWHGFPDCLLCRTGT